MRRRYRKRRISDFVLTLLLLLVLGMGVGYSVFSTTLTIDGTSDIDSATWSIYFANIQVTSGSVAATTPSIINNKTIGFSVILAEPGDFYEFTADVINGGTLNAKLGSISMTPALTGTLANYFNYTVTYSDGTAINPNDALDKGTSEKIKVRVEYKTSTYHSSYPTSDSNFTFGVEMEYLQGKGNMIRDQIYYYFGSTQFVLGSGLPAGVSQSALYSDGMTAMNSFGHPFCTKQTISKTNGLLSETEIIFTNGTDIFGLGGADATYNSGTGQYNDDSADYSNRASIMTMVFGSSNCSTNSNGNHYEYGCMVSSPFNLLVVTTTQGETYATDGNYTCGLGPDGISYCTTA